VLGLREELVTALIKTLPKHLRRLFAPAPDHARAVLSRLQAGSEPLLDGLERELGRMRNVTIPRDAWELDRLPEHLTVTFRVLDERGREVARGTDLEKLRHELAPKVRARAGHGRCRHRGDRLTRGRRLLPGDRRPRAARRHGCLGSSIRHVGDVRVFRRRPSATRRTARRPAAPALETPSPARTVARNWTTPAG
jgi:ATP-dependent helicase HrpA